MDSALRFLRRSWDTVTLTLALAVCVVASVPLGHTAAWIPRIVLAVTLALVIVQLVREARELTKMRQEESRKKSVPAIPLAGDASSSRAGQETVPAPMRMTSPVVAVLWVAGLLLSVLMLGAAAGCAVHALAYLRWHARASSLSSGIFALALGASVQLAFSTLLHVDLYRGWLWNAAQ